MKVILSVPDEGYSQTCIVHTKLTIYICIIFSVVLSLIQTIHGLSTSSLKPLSLTLEFVLTKHLQIVIKYELGKHLSTLYW